AIELGFQAKEVGQELVFAAGVGLAQIGVKIVGLQISARCEVSVGRRERGVVRQLARGIIDANPIEDAKRMAAGIVDRLLFVGQIQIVEGIMMDFVEIDPVLRDGEAVGVDHIHVPRVGMFFGEQFVAFVGGIVLVGEEVSFPDQYDAANK